MCARAAGPPCACVFLCGSVGTPDSVAVGRGSFGRGLRPGVPFDGALYHQFPISAGGPSKSLFCLVRLSA